MSPDEATTRRGAPAGTHTESCRQCGATLEYLDRARDAVCTVCGRAEQAHVVCPEGHYVCDECHGAGFLAHLEALLDAESSTSPHEIAEALMRRADLPMLGCEHAHIAAGALMRALENTGKAGVTAAHRREALERTARQAVGAYCGLTGVCGVVPALGACYSVLVGARCGRGAETEATMRLVARLVDLTAQHARPGCCKAFVRAGLQETASFLEERLGISLDQADPVVCAHVHLHPHGCRGPQCDWHPEHGGSAASGEKREAGMTTDETTASMRAPGTSHTAQSEYDRFFSIAYAAGALDEKTKILISLGASLASGCAP